MHIVNVAFGITSWMVCGWVIYCWIKLRSTHLRISTLRWIYSRVDIHSESQEPLKVNPSPFSDQSVLFLKTHFPFFFLASSCGSSSQSFFHFASKVCFKYKHLRMVMTCKNHCKISLQTTLSQGLAPVRDSNPLNVYLINRIGLIEDSCRHCDQASSKKEWKYY